MVQRISNGVVGGLNARPSSSREAVRAGDAVVSGKKSTPQDTRTTTRRVRRNTTSAQQLPPARRRRSKKGQLYCPSFL